MSNSYTPTTNFGAKDSLSASDPNKVVRGSEFSTEFSAIENAFAASAPKASPTFTGTATFETIDVADLSASGTATLSGIVSSSAVLPFTGSASVSGHVSIGNTETPSTITATALDDLIVGSLGSDGGVVVLSSDTGTGAYAFIDDAAGSIAGRIVYQHSTDEMSFDAGSSQRARLTGSGQFAVCRSTDAPDADDKMYVGTAPDAESFTVSGIEADGNCFIRIDSTVNRRNALVFETSGSGAFTLERGDSDISDSTALYLHPGEQDGGASSDMKMASDGAVSFEQTLTAPRFRTSSGSFTAAATGSTTQTVSVPDGTYIVSVLADGAANIEINTTAIVHSRTNMVSGVTVLANNSFAGNATCSIQPKDNASAFTFDGSRDNLFDIVITNTLGNTTIPVTYNIVRIG